MMKEANLLADEVIKNSDLLIFKEKLTSLEKIVFKESLLNKSKQKIAKETVLTYKQIDNA